MSEKEPSFEDLVADMNSPAARAVIPEITMSAAADPFSAEVSDFEKLERIAEEETPRPPDDNENRYGVSLLHDIYVAKKNSNNNYGKFGRFDFLPRLALIPFYDTVFDIPAEQTGRVVVGESIDDILTETAGNFDFDASNAAIAGGFNKIKKSAKMLADLFTQDHAAHGAGILTPLQKLKYAQAKRIYLTVLPYDDKAFWLARFGEARCKPRRVLGYTLDDAPSLDVLIEYLEKYALDRIENSDLAEWEMQKAVQINDLLIAYAETAEIYAKQKLDEKEQEIKDGKTRGGYDRPNRLVFGAPKPPDLVRLAHLNRVPMDERARAEIMEMGNALAAGMAQGTPAPQNFAAPGNAGAGQPGGYDLETIVNMATERAKEQLKSDPAFMAEVEQSVLKNAGLIT